MKEKKKIYILHGWADSTDKWVPFMELLKEKKFDPVLLKIPGLTASLNKVWTLDNYVEWLRDSIVNEKEKVILLGHSNGGRINLAFTFKYPEKVSKLILIDSAGIYHNEFPIRIKRLVFGLIAKAGKKIRDVKSIRRLFYRLIMEHDYEKADPVLRKTMQNLINSDLSKSFEKIDVPTVIIWGENDSITPLKDGELMHQNIRNSKLFIIKNARHSPQFTNVKEVVGIVSKTMSS